MRAYSGSAHVLTQGACAQHTHVPPVRSSHSYGAPAPALTDHSDQPVSRQSSLVSHPAFNRVVAVERAGARGDYGDQALSRLKGGPALCPGWASRRLRQGNQPDCWTGKKVIGSVAVVIAKSE